MPSTYDSIASANAIGGSGSVTFSSIPSSYTDLRLVISAKTALSTQLFMRYNNDGTNVYGTYSLLADGFSWAQYFETSSYVRLVESSTIGTSISVFETWIIDIMDYASSSKSKSCLVSASQRNAQIMYKVGTYTPFDVINRIDIILNSGAFENGSRVALYGITRA